VFSADNSFIALSMYQNKSSESKALIPVDGVVTRLESTASASCAINPFCTPDISSTFSTLVNTSVNSGLADLISSFVLYSKVFTCN